MTSAPLDNARAVKQMNQLVSMWGIFSSVAGRDLRIAFRHKGELLNPLFFFLMAVSMIPLGVSPERKLLAILAPGIVWVMALLATLLSLDNLFRRDYDDGSLDQLLVSPAPLYWVVIAKVTAHWLYTGLPLTLMSPLLALMLALPAEGVVPLMLSLFLGTGVLSFIGAVGAALTVSLRRGGLLIALIVMPLYVPVLIFGTAVVTRTLEGFSAAGPLSMLGAFLAGSVLLVPFATAGALRIR